MRRHGLRCRGRDRAHLFSLIMPCASRSPRGRCACAVRTAALQGAAAHLGTHAFSAKQALCQSIRPLRWRLPPLAEQQIGAAVGRNKRRGAKSALPICGHPAHGWAPPAVGTPGEGGDDHRQRRRAAPWSLPERQPAPWAGRGVSSSGQDAHASRPAASWYGRRRCWRACRSGVAGAFSSAAPAGKSEGPTAAASGRRGRTNLSAACSPRRHLAGHGETPGGPSFAMAQALRRPHAPRQAWAGIHARRRAHRPLVVAGIGFAHQPVATGVWPWGHVPHQKPAL